MNMAALTDHSEITKALALKESREHLGPEMEALKLDMQSRATTISGSLLINSNPTTTTNNCFNTIKKTVHFIRHGQGFHNLLADMARASNKTWTQFQVEPNNPYTMPEVTDAPLTDKGRNQAMLLRNETKNLGTELVVVSPLCRATQTGLLAFSHIVGSVPFVANEGEFHSFCLRSPLKHKANSNSPTSLMLASLRSAPLRSDCREESGVHFCDKRRAVSELKREFGATVDFKNILSEEDPLFSESGRETKKEVGERIYNFLIWLRDREEGEIGVASHSGWLMSLFNGVVSVDREEDKSLKEWFGTGEMKSVELVFSTKK